MRRISVIVDGVDGDLMWITKFCARVNICACFWCLQARAKPQEVKEEVEAEKEEIVRGVGGMADTRDPEELDHEDPRKSISAAPTFEEYLKARAAA